MVPGSDPQDSYLRYQFGREHLARGEVVEASDHLLDAYESSDHDTPCRHGIVVTALQALRRAGRFEEALALADVEYENWPASPDFYFAIADLYLDWASHNPQTALSEFLPVVEAAWQRCIDIGEQPGLEGSVEGRGSYLAAESLAGFYETLGLAEKASCYAKAASEMRA